MVKKSNAGRDRYVKLICRKYYFSTRGTLNVSIRQLNISRMYLFCMAYKVYGDSCHYYITCLIDGSYPYSIKLDFSF